MARAPRRSAIDPETVADRLLADALDRASDPIEQTIFTDTSGIADQLGDILAALSPYDQGSIKAVLHRKPPGGVGGYEWIEDLTPPFDMSSIMSYLKGKVGGGSFRMALFAGGRTRKNIEFSIMADPKPATPPDPFGGNSAIMMLMSMQAEARKDAAEQQRFFMEQQARRDSALAEERRAAQAQLMATIGIVVPVVAPLLFGGREKLSDLLAMINASKPADNKIKETFEIITLAKGLSEGGGDKFDPTDLAGSIARLAGPALSGLSKAFPARRQAGEDVEYEEEPQATYTPAPQALPSAAAGETFAPPPAAAAGPSQYPVLNLIKPHVAYYFSVREAVDPGLAAEAIGAIIDRAQIPEEDINALVAAFGLAGDNWLELLASEGIDVRGDPEWAEYFLRALIADRAAADDVDDGSGGGRGGGLANAATDAPAFTPGGDHDAGSGPGATPSGGAAGNP